MERCERERNRGKEKGGESVRKRVVNKKGEREREREYVCVCVWKRERERERERERMA